MEGAVAFDRHSNAASHFRVVVPGSVMLRATIVPHGNGIWLPPEATLKLRIGVMGIEKI